MFDLLHYLFNVQEMKGIHSLIDKEKYNSVRNIISNRKDQYEDRMHYITTKNNFFAKATVNIIEVCDVLEDYFINQIENQVDDRARV